jgi:plastocyanin
MTRRQPITAARLRAVAIPGLAAVVVLVVALLVRSSSPSLHESRAAAQVVRTGHVKVTVRMFAFSPSKLTVKAGTHITFTNYDSTAHTATALSGAFGTGTIEPKHSATITVTKPGVYPYHCLFHAFMTGTITVVR